MTAVVWTDEIDAALRRHAAAGRAGAVVAAVMGLTLEDVYVRSRMLGLDLTIARHKTMLSCEAVAAIRDRVPAAGVEAVAGEIGVAEVIVREYAEALGVRRAPRILEDVAAKPAPIVREKVVQERAPAARGGRRKPVLADEVKDVICAKALDGMAFKAIAAETGASLRDVKAVLDERGVALRGATWAKADDALLRLFYLGGEADYLFVQEIADLFGRSAEAVRCRVRVLKLPMASRSDRLGDELRDAILADIKAGMSRADIAARYDRHETTISRVASAAGVAFARIPVPAYRVPRAKIEKVARERKVVERKVKVAKAAKAVAVRKPKVVKPVAVSSIQAQAKAMNYPVAVKTVFRPVEAPKTDATAAMIADFIARKGVTREQVSERDRVTRELRRRGYMIVADGAEFVIDGRHRVRGEVGLFEFARVRGIHFETHLEAAE